MSRPSGQGRRRHQVQALLVQTPGWLSRFFFKLIFPSDNNNRQQSILPSNRQQQFQLYHTKGCRQAVRSSSVQASGRHHRRRRRRHRPIVVVWTRPSSSIHHHHLVVWVSSELISSSSSSSSTHLGFDSNLLRILLKAILNYFAIKLLIINWFEFIINQTCTIIRQPSSSPICIADFEFIGLLKLYCWLLIPRGSGVRSGQVRVRLDCSSYLWFNFRINLLFDYWIELFAVIEFDLILLILYAKYWNLLLLIFDFICILILFDICIEFISRCIDLINYWY